ncbi:MAG: hypothetical protein Q8L37_01070 [Candidatus Gottesmanbacteria bacterium]|nr:hypothetical protein [Candidatus Gottesmanbacteria bacterium]
MAEVGQPLENKTLWFGAGVPEKSRHVERFNRINVASEDLSLIIAKSLTNAGVEKRYSLGASVFFLPEALHADDKTDLPTILAKAKEKGIQVVVYSGGINWRGGKFIREEETIRSGEGLRRKGLIALSQDISSERFQDLSPESKKEETYISALNFLAETGKSVVITLDPELRMGSINASFLRADAIAKKTILEQIRASGAEALMVNWSDGGFKDIQIQLDGFIQIVEDIRHAVQHGLISAEDAIRIAKNGIRSDDEYTALSSVLENVKVKKEMSESKSLLEDKINHKKQHLRGTVFSNGFEALEYFQQYKDFDTINGASPALASELAHPFTSTDRNRFKRTYLRNLANNLVKLVGANESNPIVDGILHNVLPTQTIDQSGDALVIFRLLEIGRGNMPRADLESNETSIRIARHMIARSLGDGVDVTVGDTSGVVVNAASPEIGTPTISNLIHGQKSLYLETRDNPDAPSIHSEIKRALPEIERLIAAHKLGLITQNIDHDPVIHRYIPVHLIEEEIDHPNGSKLHKPRKLDWVQYEQLMRESEIVQDETVNNKKRLLDLVQPLFER